MEFDINKLPKDMKVTSDPLENDIDLVRQRLRKQRFDHLNYDPFVNTDQG